MRHFCCADSRPAMTMLASAPPWTTAPSINPRRATPILPIAISRSSPSPHRPLAKQAVNQPRQQSPRDEITITPDAPHCSTSRGFLPWRFAYAGPGVRCATVMGPTSANLHRSSQSGAAFGVRSRRILWLRSVAHYSAPARDRNVSRDDRHRQSWIPEVRFGCFFVQGVDGRAGLIFCCRSAFQP